ncbi:MAG: glycoside hydrolase family 16 protein [Bacteroidetes bacterium]|jgi:beta-glucanase (GH16 family)|nr:glycoside hydrolase family 16 protein [Bacteroidota bacterium]
MHKHFYAWVFLLACSSCKHHNDEWELTFSEEFNGKSVDFTTWSPNFSWGQHASEDNQCYMVDDVFEVDNGILRIRCERRDTMAKVFLPDWSMTTQQFHYVSGHLYSRNSFSQQYGYFEMRAKTAFGHGFNSAFWMMAHTGWPPEIDIFEVLGRDPNNLRTSNHFLDKNGEHGMETRFHTTHDLSSTFNVFAMEWDPAGIKWYLNGNLLFTSTNNIPQEPMYLLISHALGGDFAGYADEHTVLPAYFEIDYVRVYQRVER